MQMYHLLIRPISYYAHYSTRKLHTGIILLKWGNESLDLTADSFSFFAVCTTMGSNQSSPANTAPAREELEASSHSRAEKSSSKNDNESDGDLGAKRKIRQKRRGKELEGFARVQHRCRRKKREYDKCYKGLYGDFVGGQLEETSEDCDDLFDSYKKCILMGMKNDRDQRGLRPARSGSALAVFKEELDEEE